SDLVDIDGADGEAHGLHRSHRPRHRRRDYRTTPLVTCNVVCMSTKDRVRRHRERRRAQGLRPIQIWVPDVTAPGFADEAHSQSAAVAARTQEAGDQAFVDSLSTD